MNICRRREQGAFVTPAFQRPNTVIRRAICGEAGLARYLRFASLHCLDMAEYPLDAVQALIESLPDVDAGLVAAGTYYLAETDGDLIGGAGWSVLPLRFPGGRLIDEHGRTTGLSLAANTVIVRGFFLDPDLGRRGAGAQLLARIEIDAGRAGHAAVELVVPASSQIVYRRLGFRPVRRLGLDLGGHAVLPLMQMRKGFAARLAIAA